MSHTHYYSTRFILDMRKTIVVYRQKTYVIDAKLLYTNASRDVCTPKYIYNMYSDIYEQFFLFYLNRLESMVTHMYTCTIYINSAVSMNPVYKFSLM